MKHKPADPLEYVPVRDAIELDVLTSRVIGETGVVIPDQRTKMLGDKLTGLLLLYHTVDLRAEGKRWDGDYTFTSSKVIFFAEITNLHPGVLEAVRRGMYPHKQLTSVYIQFLETLVELLSVRLTPS